MPKTVFIGLGANLGDARAACEAAIERLSRLPGCRWRRRSHYYLTQPVGTPDQPWFVNAVGEVGASGPPEALLEDLLAIEAALGRRRSADRWAARPIDLDILLFGNDVIATPRLSVPHPRMHQRRFVLVPLVELAPRVCHPVFKRPLKEMLAELPPDGQQVILLEEAP